MNPFKKDELKTTFTKCIENQVYILELNESAMIDCSGRSKTTTRQIIKRVGNKLGWQFRTKSDIDGNLWVKRVY